MNREERRAAVKKLTKKGLTKVIALSFDKPLLVSFFTAALRSSRFIVTLLNHLYNNLIK